MIYFLELMFLRISHREVASTVGLMKKVKLRIIFIFVLRHPDSKNTIRSSLYICMYICVHMCP
jgi:hypothetical protein